MAVLLFAVFYSLTSGVAGFIWAGALASGWTAGLEIEIVVCVAFEFSCVFGTRLLSGIEAELCVVGDALTEFTS